MRLELDADEQQLQDSLRRLLQAQASFERRREAARSDAGWDTALWPALGELGVIALTLPQAHGGFAQPPVAQLTLLQALGHALALQPFLPSAVLAATAIARAGSEAQQQVLLAAIAQGSSVVAWAHDEPAARHNPLWVEAGAERDGGDWLLHGSKHNVLYGAAADTLIVSARAAGEPGAAHGLQLFMVNPAQPGVRRRALRLIDDTPAADIEFRGARADLLDAGSAPDAIRAAQEAGIAAVCAEALGVVERAYELSVKYVQVRQQFGRAIGANQTVRHRVAEMRVALEMMRSAALAGLLALQLEQPADRSRELSRAKMLISRHGGFITQQAIQLHGGIGMTVEYAVGHCLRRLTVLDQLFGDGATHAAALAAGIVAKDDVYAGPAA